MKVWIRPLVVPVMTVKIGYGSVVGRTGKDSWKREVKSESNCECSVMLVV